MLNAEIKTDVLAKFINAVSILDDKCRLNVNGNELSINVTDPSNVCMANVKLEKEAFETYEANDLMIGLDLNVIIKILKNLKGAKILSLEYDKEENGLNLLSDQLDFSVTLLPLDSIRETTKIPDMVYNAELTVDSNNLKQAIKLVAKTDDSLNIEVDRKEGLKLKAKNKDSNMVYKVALDDLIDCKTQDKITSEYDLDYLSRISNIINGKIKLKMGTDYPISICSIISKDVGAVEYLLAPIIRDV